jgi:hypothetical protein
MHLWDALRVEPFAESRNARCGCAETRCVRGSGGTAPASPQLSHMLRIQLEVIMNIRLVLLAAAVAAVPSFANAQSTTGEGARRGAATGNEVGGPVGAIVGGTVGAAVGAAVEIPNALITSVQRSDAPSVAVRERIVVGERLPPAVRLRSVPEYPNYRYAVVNEQRVIVEPRTRKIVHIID